MNGQFAGGGLEEGQLAGRAGLEKLHKEPGQKFWLNSTPVSEGVNSQCRLLSF